MTMALDSALARLGRDLGLLSDALLALRVTVIEDRPLDEGTLLVDSLGDLAEELLVGAGEAAAYARAGDLSSCHETYHRVLGRFAADLVSYERIAEIVRLGRSRGGEWQAWSGSVRAGAEACRSPLDEVGDSLLACWREAAEPTGLPAPLKDSESTLRTRR